MTRTGLGRDRAAQNDREWSVAHEVRVTVVAHGRSGSRVGRRYIALLIAILAVVTTVLALTRATGTATHPASQRVRRTLVQGSFAAESYGSRLALEEARERGPDPDRDTR